MNKPNDERFRPGAGLPPPEFVGRDDEMATISEALDELEARLCPTANIVLVGPRGNGKTALLRRVQARVDQRGGKIECIALIADHFNSYHDLVDSLAGQEIFPALREDGYSATINLFESEAELSRQGAAKKLLKPVLEKRCSKNGLAILIDEAHMFSNYRDVARLFFNEVQALASDLRPLLLILAGTPNIQSRLSKVEATFWDRLDKISIGLLDADAAQDALQKPLNSMGYCVETDTLKNASKAAQYYPYFLQVIGRELHRAAKAAPDKLVRGEAIGDAVLEQALKKFSFITNNYYSGRYRELRACGILRSAEAVAETFVSYGNKPTPAAKITAVVAESIDMKLEEVAKLRGGIDPAAWVEEELLNFGFFWSHIGKEEFYEPGIPSLMNYILNGLRARTELESMRSDTAFLQ